MRAETSILLTALALLSAACAAPLPKELPPLRQMEEPLALFDEPDDEAARRALPLGAFTGVVPGPPQPAADVAGPPGVEVAAVVAQSPAAAAGLAVGDLLQTARVDAGPARALHHPSDWRAVELAAAAGTPIEVVLDRAGLRVRTEVIPEARLHPLPRTPATRVREEERAGIVLRTATEVEARAAGLPPGAGAVVVGMDRASPWRAAGVGFGDLIVRADGRPVAHPSVVTAAVARAGDHVTLALHRDGAPLELRAPLTRRARDLREIFVPLVLDHESARGEAETSVLLGLFRYRETRTAWEVGVLWFFGFGGGDADRLLEAGG